MTDSNAERSMEKTAKTEAKPAGYRKGGQAAGRRPRATSKKRQPHASQEPPRTPLLNRADQLGATLAKGLDLAEAGLSLGLTLINRFGSMVQESILASASDRPHPSAQPQPGHHGDGPEPTAAGRSSQDPAGAAEESYCIANRLPVTPGQRTQVSFSINNDSPSAARQVRLELDGFVGQVSGTKFSCTGFIVKPNAKTIAPMDFEKFVLRGEVPQGIPSDVYHGKVIVVSDQAFEIPVKLLVVPPGL